LFFAKANNAAGIRSAWRKETTMLILTRKAGESLVIANNIVVTVIGTNNGQVRLGIEAPADVVVDREEIHERRQRDLEVANAGA
jgi:carbon storage regulator